MILIWRMTHPLDLFNQPGVPRCTRRSERTASTRTTRIRSRDDRRPLVDPSRGVSRVIATATSARRGRSFQVSKRRVMPPENPSDERMNRINDDHNTLLTADGTPVRVGLVVYVRVGGEYPAGKYRCRTMVVDRIKSAQTSAADLRRHLRRKLRPSPLATKSAATGSRDAAGPA